MTTYPERQKFIQWINEAVNSGARKMMACKTIGLNIRTVQRWIKGGCVLPDKRPIATRPVPKNSLTPTEIDRVIQVCTSPEFADVPPSRIVPILADRGIYIASESSFYRILKAHNLQHHRGRQKPRGTYVRPKSYTATGPNQVWSWDITHLPSRLVGGRYYLYMIEDIYSRKIVGSEVFEHETGEHAADLLQRAAWTEKCANKNLVLHSDNGSPMKSFTMQAKMFELGVTASRSRPRVSNDNPFSESLFRTLKYCPQWPRSGFSDIAEARAWVEKFVAWYNNEHRHSKIKFVTPNQRHSGKDIGLLKRRQQLYEQMKVLHPQRWSCEVRNWSPETTVALNPEKGVRRAA